VAVDADGAVTAPGSPAGLDGQPGSRTETIQLLTPEGERVEHPDYPLELTTGQIKDLYTDLVLVRRIDTEAIALQRQGELGIWASLLGQEAAQVGSGRALGPRDMAFPTYREHGVAWCRGLDPTRLLELFRGVSHAAAPITMRSSAMALTADSVSTRAEPIRSRASRGPSGRAGRGRPRRRPRRRVRAAAGCRVRAWP